MAKDILDTIDGALGDWATSGDAMRWSPEPGKVPAGLPGFQEQISLEALTRLAEAVRPVMMSMAQFAEGMRSVGDAILGLKGVQASFVIYDECCLLVPCASARCRACNPRGNPPPVAGKYKPGPKAARMRRRVR
jgi:hypothetical protein